MGKLIEGEWHPGDHPPNVGPRGEFVRPDPKFRGGIADDEHARHPPARDRYCLLVAMNCPWCHRVLIARHLKGLEETLPILVAHYRRNEHGWWFPEGIDDFRPDPHQGQLPLHRFYSCAKPDYTGSATVPVLWDRHLKTMVNNESSDILRILDRGFPGLADDSFELYPEELQTEIDEVNEWVYTNINNGVYRCGFARTQEAYEEAFGKLFEALDAVEARLDRHRYLVSHRITEADVRLFPTLIRFDAVYYSHFKCNWRRIADYPNLSGYIRDLYQTPAFRQTVDIELYKRGYYGRSPRLNPSAIIPVGPELRLDAPHGRADRQY